MLNKLCSSTMVLLVVLVLSVPLPSNSQGSGASTAAPQGMPPEIAGMFGATSAQGSGASTAAPQGMPPEIAGMFGATSFGGGEVTVAPPEKPARMEVPTPGPTTAGSRYLYTTLRVITNGSSRGCSYANWTCMTNLCTSDLGSSAWRGWAGCWRDGSNYICYFECGQQRDAF
jgi:hypothetical protein